MLHAVVEKKQSKNSLPIVGRKTTYTYKIPKILPAVVGKPRVKNQGKKYLPIVVG